MKPLFQYAVVLGAVSAAWAQPAPPAQPPTPRPAAAPARGAAPAQPAPAMVARGMGMPASKWWDNPEISARLGLSDEQKKKMDDVFQASRIRLIDLRAALEKEEAMLDPLMQAATPDDSKLLPQIDKVAQARAELEKADARLLLGLRHVLSPQQWQNLQAERMQPRPATAPGPRGFGAGQGIGRGMGQGMGPGNPPPPPAANPPGQGPTTPPPPPGGRGGEGDQQ